MAKPSLINVAFLLGWAVSASAQPTSPSTTATPNSGAGIQGMPGNKSGPAVRPSTSSNGSAGPNATTPQEAARLPGAPGTKSGPTVKPPGEK